MPQLRLVISLLALGLVCSCGSNAKTNSNQISIPLDLLPRVLAYAALEEMRTPIRQCNSQGRNTRWIDIIDELRASDLALREGSNRTETYQSDSEITRRLSEEIQANGWPDACELGDSTSKKLWFIIQHSPDRELRRSSIDFFEQAADYGFIPNSQLATMHDRILMHDGEPQIYGTQYLCNSDTGEYERWDTMDIENLETRRENAGLIPGPWELRIMNHRRTPCT